MLFLIVFLCAVLVALGLGLLSAASDFRGMTIPNSYALGILLAFVFAFIAAMLAKNPEPFQIISSHLWAGGVAFVITFLMAVTRTMGAGDSKLITVYALWMGMQHVAWYLLIVTFWGALFAIIAIVLKRFKPFKNVRPGSWIARTQAGEAVVAYGIPIVLGAFCIFFTEHYLSVSTLKAFIVPAEVAE